jgi:hypothetical protein
VVEQLRKLITSWPSGIAVAWGYSSNISLTTVVLTTKYFDKLGVPRLSYPQLIFPQRIGGEI